jgi:hypothetical protein
MELLHKVLSIALPFIHLKRLTVLLQAVDSLLQGKKLSLSHLGRCIQNGAKERHNIRKVDRLLANKHLHKEIKYFYQAINLLLIQKIKEPVITVDWSPVNKNKDNHILRASINLKGRSHTIYQRVHPQEEVNSSKAEKQFLNDLRSILPPDVTPIIVTDSGYRCPWFKEVERLGMNWVGRIRNKNSFRQLGEKLWQSTYDLYQKATTLPRYLGKVYLTKTSALECHLVIVRKGSKGRKKLNRNGSYCQSTESKRCSKRQIEPWLLATSLEVTQLSAKKIVAYYEKRMQIEQEFRDIKSHRYGFGLRYSGTTQIQRIEVLLLIATLATLACWLISLAAQRKKMHLDFQANSIKTRQVLSVIYLACQIYKRFILFKESELMASFFELHELIKEVSYA